MYVPKSGATITDTTHDKISAIDTTQNMSQQNSLAMPFEKATGISIPYVIAPRRPGDIAENYADPSKAKKLLGWQAEKTLEDMCRDTYRFQQKNPKGYRS